MKKSALLEKALPKVNSAGKLLVKPHKKTLGYDDVSPLDEPVKKIKPKDKVHYVNGKEFTERITDFYTTGKLSYELGDSLNKIANGLSYSPNFINYCLGLSAEALTKRGWLKYNEITEADTILSYDIKTNQLEWSRIKSIYRGHHIGSMVCLSGANINTAVTPGHKFVTKENGLTPIELIDKTDTIILTPSLSIKADEVNITPYHYEGIVWCPETEYGTWFCRDNNTTFVTSNSYKEDMIGDAIVKMYSALKEKKFRLNTGFSPFSYFTTIAFHAFINRIKKEKKHHEAVTQYREKVYMETMTSKDDNGNSYNIYVGPNPNNNDED